MVGIATDLQRTVVHRHTESGRAFWRDITAAVTRCGEERTAAIVDALLLRASSGPPSLEAWLTGVAGATPRAQIEIAAALTRFHPPRPERHPAVARARQAVLRATR